MVPAEIELPARPTKRLREKTNLGEKRKLEVPLEDREHPQDDQGDFQMNLLQTLAIEAKAGEADTKSEEEEQIQLTSG